jgi:hypothetical protein
VGSRPAPIPLSFVSFFFLFCHAAHPPVFCVWPAHDTEHDVAGAGCGALVAKLLFEDAHSARAQLSTISVAHNSMGAAGMLQLAEGLRDNASLTALDVAANYAGPKALAALCRALSSTAVCALDISLNNACPGGATEVSHACHRGAGPATRPSPA